MVQAVMARAKIKKKKKKNTVKAAWFVGCLLTKSLQIEYFPGISRLSEHFVLFI